MGKIAAFWLAVSVAAVGCNTKVEQVKPPRIPDDPAADAKALEGVDDASDMAGGEKKELEPDIKTPAQIKHLCCQECSAAMKDNRSPETADKIPCVDFTAAMQKSKHDCLDFFRKNPMMASDAQTCAAKPYPKPKSDD